MSVCPSAWKNWLPLDGFSLNYIFEYLFLKICPKIVRQHSTIRTVHTTYAAALKITTHPKTRCRKPYAVTQHLLLLMMGVCTPKHVELRTQKLRAENNMLQLNI
jgi:hypothetical protein